MVKTAFDSSLTKLMEEALYLSLEYTDYSNEIERMYIYIPLEVSCMYLVFFKINNHISFKSKLNDYATKVDTFDTSSENQKWLNAQGNQLAKQIREYFLDTGQAVPTHMKMTYEPQTGKFDCKMNYEPHLDFDNMVGELTIHFRWFAEEGGELEPWQQI